MQNKIQPRWGWDAKIFQTLSRNSGLFIFKPFGLLNHSETNTGFLTQPLSAISLLRNKNIKPRWGGDAKMQLVKARRA